MYPDTQTPADLMLARLYAQRGEAEQVEPILQKLLQSPTPARIEFTASFYAQRGQREQARAALAKLDGLEIASAQKALIRGAVYAQYLEPQKGIEFIRQALQAQPGNAGAHRLLIATLLRTGDYEGATQAVRAAAEAAPDSDLLHYLDQHWNVTRIAQQTPIAGALVRAMINSEQYRQIARRALTVLTEAQQVQDLSEQRLSTLRQLADDNPSFFALQTVTAQLHIAAGQPEPAARIARRTMQLFANSPTPARLAAEALAATGDWQASLNAGRAWRQRLGQETVPADLMIAEAQMQLGQPSQAAASLQPHIEQALQNPDNNATIILSQARARLEAGQVDAAAELLRPLLQDSAQWRVRWMQLAAEQVPDAETAAAWIQRAAKLIDAEGQGEQLQLAQAWYNLGQRTGEARFQDRAKEAVQPLIEGEAPAALAHQMLGMIYQAEQNLAESKQHYRRAIELNPELAIAANNLAMVIMESGGSLKEAEQFVRQALKQSANQPAFRDTLAQILANQGDYTAAAEQQAQAANRSSRVSYRIQLAHYQVQAEQYEQARQQLQAIEESDVDLSALSETHRRRLQSVREQLQQEQASAAQAG